MIEYNQDLDVGKYRLLKSSRVRQPSVHREWKGGRSDAGVWAGWRRYCTWASSGSSLVFLLDPNVREYLCGSSSSLAWSIEASVEEDGDIPLIFSRVGRRSTKSINSGRRLLTYLRFDPISKYIKDSGSKGPHVREWSCKHVKREKISMKSMVLD